MFYLKSSMERFIDDDYEEETTTKPNLKSSMERFIV